MYGKHRIGYLIYGMYGKHRIDPICNFKNFAYLFKSRNCPFVSYRTRFSQVYSHIIELKKNNMRQNDVTV